MGKPNVAKLRGKVVVDGKTYPAKLAGKGSFSRVFEVEGHKPPILAFVPDATGEFSKDVMAEAHRSAPTNPHIPAVMVVGETPNSRVFGMPRYKMPLRKADSAKAWAEYRTLRAAWEVASTVVEDTVMRQAKASKGRFNVTRRDHGHTLMDAMLAEVQGKIPARLFAALTEIRGVAVNYGADYTFEVSPRNLGTDSRGRLVLVDVVFGQEAMYRIRMAPFRAAQVPAPRRR